MGGIPNRLSVNQQKLVSGSESCWFGQELFRWGPNEKNFSDPENIHKKIVENEAIFAFSPAFSALGAPFWGCALTRLSRVKIKNQKRAKNAENWIFLVLGAVLGETPTDQI